MNEERRAKRQPRTVELCFPCPSTNICFAGVLSLPILIGHSGYQELCWECTICLLLEKQEDLVLHRFACVGDVGWEAGGTPFPSASCVVVTLGRSWRRWMGWWHLKPLVQDLLEFMYWAPLVNNPSWLWGGYFKVAFISVCEKLRCCGKPQDEICVGCSCT